MKPIKKIFPLLIVAAMALLSPTKLQARFILGFEFSGQQEIVDKASLVSQKDTLLGFSLGGFGWGEGIQMEIRLGYGLRKAEQIGYGLDKIADFSLYLGARYHNSEDPTFSLGKTEVRLTLSALGGFTWLSGGGFSTLPQFSALLSGGLSISPGGIPSDIMIEFVYRPVSMNMEMRGAGNVLVGTLLFKPSWCIRMSVLF
jgi:hypothetical protein